MWKDSIKNIVVIFQTTILRIVGFYVRHSAHVFVFKFEPSGSDLEKIRLIHHRQTMHRQNKPHDA